VLEMKSEIKVFWPNIENFDFAEAMVVVRNPLNSLKKIFGPGAGVEDRARFLKKV
jgi:hypothetical protein